eukprot:scaffold4771_cov50-Prasinocladus_malaysianus.AAC.1
MDKENIKILQIVVQEPGLGFVTELTLPTFEEQYNTRRRLAQVAAEQNWRQIGTEMESALYTNIQAIFLAATFSQYGTPMLEGQVAVQELWGQVEARYEPLAPGAYDPGVFDWVSLAEGVGTVAPPSIDYGGSYGGYYDYYYYGEYASEDTTTIIASFQVAFMTSNGCEFSSSTFSEGFLSWYRMSLLDYFSKCRSQHSSFSCLQKVSAGVSDVGYESISGTVELASNLGSGAAGPCDVPVQVDTSIAFPAFVPGDVVNEGAVRYAVESFSADVNNLPSSIWQ